MLIAAVSVLFFSVFALADKPLGKSMVKHVKAKEAGELVNANKDNAGFVVLDVRTAGEVKEVCILNAMNIDIRSSEFVAKAVKLNKERTYLVHCSSGARSQTALKALQKLGFLKLYHLDGGIMAWEKEGLQVEKGK